jgi:N-acetylmuramic acid 6-phosphate etherase
VNGIQPIIPRVSRRSKSKKNTRPLILGIEGGGTRSVALMADGQGNLVGRREAGPGNLRLLDDGELRGLLEEFAGQFPTPDAVGIGMAGARTEGDLRRIRKAAESVWPGIPCRSTDDLETALSAADEPAARGIQARVLVLSGTGSCFFGRNAENLKAKVGGWGHILGDGGSGYDIGLGALRAVATLVDETGKLPVLGKRIVKRLRLERSEALISWAQAAKKADIAALAAEVFQSAAAGDRLAGLLLQLAKNTLAREATVCARKLAKPGTSVQFILAGGTLLKQPRFAEQVSRQIKEFWPKAAVTPLKREGAWGAVKLARKTWESRGQPLSPEKVLHGKRAVKPGTAQVEKNGWAKGAVTEQRNPRSANLDKLSAIRAVELMLSEDAKIAGAILKYKWEIARAVDLTAAAFRQGGRLIYVGAGTSGRLGVLDASECPPTFRTPPEMVQGIIAGGPAALSRSVEGAEDDLKAGAQAIAERRICGRDVVVGITASGRTPFVWGALDAAKRSKAKTVLICFNPFESGTGHKRPTVVIAPQVGPEVLTGSTRLKAGTATKLILNMLTTLAMARTGRVAGNLMVDLNPSNVKLRDRAVRIVGELCGVDEATARRALERSGWNVQRARRQLRRGQ